jgi:hypothetical protein
MPFDKERGSDSCSARAVAELTFGACATRRFPVHAHREREQGHALQEVLLIDVEVHPR